MESMKELALRAEEAINSAQECRRENVNQVAALAELQRVITEFEAVQGAYEGDKPLYYSFANPLEMHIYYLLYQPTGQEISQLFIPAAALYREKAALLRSASCLPEARRSLMTARRWNPVSPHIALDYAELMKELGETEEYIRLLRELHPLIYSGNCLARYYNGFAYYFVGKEMWPEAVCCYFKSLQFNADAENEVEVVCGLTEIQHKHGIDFKTPSVKQLDACIKECHLPVRGDEKTAKELFALGKAMQQKEPTGKLAYAACVAAWEISLEREIREFINTCWPAEKPRPKAEVPVYRV